MAGAIEGLLTSGYGAEVAGWRNRGVATPCSRGGNLAQWRLRPTPCFERLPPMIGTRQVRLAAARWALGCGLLPLLLGQPAPPLTLTL